MRKYNLKRDIAYYECYIAGLKDARFLVMSKSLAPREQELERLRKELKERRITWAKIEDMYRKDEHDNS